LIFNPNNSPNVENPAKGILLKVFNELKLLEFNNLLKIQSFKIPPIGLEGFLELKFLKSLSV
jgi:hypothetical protein